jgi:hypothetical protein
VENSLNTVVDATKQASDKIIPNLGVGTATGYAVFTVLKNTAGLPPVQRLTAVASTTILTAAGTKIGAELGSIVSKNMDLNKIIKNSPHSDPQPDRIPSPDSFIANSPSESDNITSPLQDLLIYSLSLDMLISFLLISTLIMIFNSYILKFNLTFINTIFNKYMPIKFNNWYNKLNTGIESTNNKFVLIMFTLNSIALVVFIIMKIFITSELLINIDSYINVHNYIHLK